jgi:hypothetical protein
MDQGKWEEMMEFLKADRHEMKVQIGGLASKMDANLEEAKREREDNKAESLRIYNPRREGCPAIPPHCL